MNSDSWLALLKAQRAIAVIRSEQLSTGYQMAQAIAAGGMLLIEVTWNSDQPANLVAKLRAALPDCWIGTGTLLTKADVTEAIAAGAQFLFTPHVERDLIYLAQDHNIPLVAGALSPTEIVTAWQAGASCVKVFPVQAVGGATYIHSLQAPLEQIPLIPTGGVTIANARDFLAAGAIAVGLASELFPKQAVAQGDWDTITRQAAQLRQQLQVFLDR